MRPLAWVPMLALRAVVDLLGLFMVPLMLATGNRPAWLFRPWRDPSGQPSWWSRHAAEHRLWLVRRFPNFWWSAVRNSANGLRTYDLISCDVDMARVEWRDNNLPINPGPLRQADRRVGWFYAWQGPYAGLWLCVLWNKTHHMKLRLGWKLIPDEDRFDTEWRPMRAGFARSTLFYRRG